MTTVKRAKKNYIQRERIEGEFYTIEDMQHWINSFRLRKYIVTGTLFAVEAPYRAIAIKNRLRKTFVGITIK